MPYVNTTLIQRFSNLLVVSVALANLYLTLRDVTSSICGEWSCISHCYSQLSTLSSAHRRDNHHLGSVKLQMLCLRLFTGRRRDLRFLSIKKRYSTQNNHSGTYPKYIKHVVSSINRNVNEVQAYVCFGRSSSD